MLDNLRIAVNKANKELYRSGLIRLSWGSVSGIDRRRNLIAITPDGLDYGTLTPDDCVIIDISGKIIQGKHKASRDALTHIELYKNFPEIGGVTHTHSVYATTFAQANREIPCYGTMHHDYFSTTISVTPKIEMKENSESYTAIAGKAITDTISAKTVMKTPGILIHGDGPITWGDDPISSVKNAKAMEAIAEIAFGTCILNTTAGC